jgi:hypothetical protein
VLLPLRDVEGARRVREDVRDAEVCVALVGDVLCAAEEQGGEGRDEGGAAVCEAGAGGAGGGGWGGGWDFAVTIRIPDYKSMEVVARQKRRLEAGATGGAREALAGGGDWVGVWLTG